MIRAVTFDYWNTLVVAHGEDLSGRRSEHWVEVLADAGHEVTREQLGEAFAASWDAFQRGVEGQPPVPDRRRR